MQPTIISALVYCSIEVKARFMSHQSIAKTSRVLQSIVLLPRVSQYYRAVRQFQVAGATSVIRTVSGGTVEPPRRETLVAQSPRCHQVPLLHATGCCSATCCIGHQATTKLKPEISCLIDVTVARAFKGSRLIIRVGGLTTLAKGHYATG